MNDVTAKDARHHLIRLAKTTGDEYEKERKAWDENSICYAWALIEALDTAVQGQQTDE